ncbi:MAG: formate/nitrite transporter family protein [Armatimonadota bacterium]|nr:formate/nitrite transporter family protein [Armatimonadota bacterium]MDR7439781.1 formate/nitrite transporter family protein [Armatimonadota bacterium]MDR7568862.1 formate/nitrite transporter family protein [Armatimonadota bacterium]
MAYVKPDEVVRSMVQVGAAKARLGAWDLLVRGMLSGALLGFATTLALTATLQTRIPLAGALVFPVGFVMIVLLGLELVTGNFALVPVAVLEGRAGLRELVRNWAWVFVGNLLGGVAYAVLFVTTVPPDSEMAKLIATLAEAKTLGYARLGVVGLRAAVVKAILCNWMVSLGVVLSFTSQSTGGKIAAMWLPILTFFAQGFEHSVVNMFVIPAGMLVGAPVSAMDWWVWNQIPVTLGNVLGGMVFTGLALYVTHGRLAGGARRWPSEPGPEEGAEVRI